MAVDLWLSLATEDTLMEWCGMEGFVFVSEVNCLVGSCLFLIVLHSIFRRGRQQRGEARKVLFACDINNALDSRC